MSGKWQNRRWARAGATALLALVLHAGTAAGQTGLYDWCTGVDHPPFEQAYDGNGASYFLIGAASPQDGPHVLVAMLDGSPMDMEFDGPGTRAVAFPIFSYGDYVWSIEDADGNVLQEGTRTVSDAEDDCSEDTLSAPPTSEPTSEAPSSPTDATTEPIDVASDTPTIVTTPDGGATSDDDGGGGDIPVWVWLGGLIILAGGGIYIGTRPRQPAPPVVAPCSCSVSVTIDGPQDLASCCMDVDYKLGKVKYQPPEDADVSADTKPRSDPSKAHLDGDVKDKDWEYSDHVLSASITASCTEGATANIADATYDWSITSSDTSVDVTVKVSVPVSCPGAAEAPEATAETTLSIPLRKAPCVITVLLEQNSWSEKLYNHCDIMITCGEYTEIFGFFPKEAGAGVLTGTPGNTQRWAEKSVNQDPNGLGVTSINDEVGEDLKKYRGGTPSKAWVITPDDCSVCAKIREWWENMDDNAANESYTLFSNNCVANVWKSLRDSGAVDPHAAGFNPDVTPANGSVLEGALNNQVGTNGVMEAVIIGG